MGSFEYGIFVLVWTTMIIVGNLACLGFHTSVIRFIPEYREKGMMDELRGPKGQAIDGALRVVIKERNDAVVRAFDAQHNAQHDANRCGDGAQRPVDGRSEA